MVEFEILHGALFAGLGAGSKGFNDARPDIGTAKAKFRCVGGIDVDPAAIADFNRIAGVPGTVMDLFSRDQYRAFWGCEPPSSWREAMPGDVQRAFGYERPHVVFLSAPCKGFSGLMSESKSRTAKYQALNELTLRGIWLTLEAYKDDPVDVFVFENVPRIATRGRHLLDQITQLLRAYGYVVAETTHDCGELGGLAQSRKRFLLVARHAEKVPPFLYEPVKRPLQSVGTVLSRMALAGDVERAGPMHRVPSLQWKTWVRLAFVEAGSDWRSLNRLAVDGGVLRDYLIRPELDCQPTIGCSVEDPRHTWSASAHSNKYRIVPFADPAGTVTGSDRVGSGAACVADPRAQGVFEGAGKYPVANFNAPSRTVIARSDTGHGAYAVADPRPTNQRQQGDAYLTNGHYGVVAWDAASGAVSAAAGHDNGKWSVADPRLPEASQNLICVIRSTDNTWHRPFTTLELAALQSLIDPEEKLELDGLSDQAWRERIGNAVPPSAACAIGEEIGRTLLLAWTGQSFALSSTPIWVRDVAVAMALPGEVRQ